MPGPSRPRGRAHRQRGGRVGRRGRGHGARRHRQHRLAAAVDRRARDGARRRRHPPRLRGGDRVRGRRHHEVKGREQPRARVDGAAGRRRSGRRTAQRRTRGAVRRPRARTAGDHRGARAERGRAAAPACRGGRRGGLRQVPAAVGVLQVPRRHRGGSLVAPGPLPVLRRGRGVLGACGDGAHPGPDQRGGEPVVRRATSCVRRSRSSSPTSASGGWSSRGSRTCCGSRSAPTPTARTCSQAGGCSSSGWPTRAGDPRLRGPAVGRLRPARVHRLPARVVRRPPDLRARSRTPGACASGGRRGSR